MHETKNDPGQDNIKKNNLIIQKSRSILLLFKKEVRLSRFIASNRKHRVDTDLLYHFFCSAVVKSRQKFKVETRLNDTI